MNKSAIEWTETTWSPVTGCDPISAGCKNCYAKREVEARWSKNPKSIWFERPFNDVQCHPQYLAGPSSPLCWRKPRRIFVCPRADLFHDDVPDLFIADVFGVMAATPWHTYQVLTKRPERMRRLLGGGNVLNFVTAVAECAAMYSEVDVEWPLKNVHLGVSIEDQPSADQRIGELLQTPAAVRWVSAEPMLGAIDIHQWLGDKKLRGLIAGFPKASFPLPEHLTPPPAIDWCVGGFESGANARPGHPAWARSLRDQCRDAGVPFLWKQNGEWVEYECGTDTFSGNEITLANTGEVWPRSVNCYGGRVEGRVHMRRVGKKAAGRLLDGVLHDAYPEVRS